MSADQSIFDSGEKRIRWLNTLQRCAMHKPNKTKQNKVNNENENQRSQKDEVRWKMRASAL